VLFAEASNQDRTVPTLLFAIYAPAFTRLSRPDFWKAVAHLKDGEVDAAQKILRTVMTIDELGAEKSELTHLTKFIVDKRAEAIIAIDALIATVLRIALKACLGV
jgi:hypothetical protein